MVKLGIQSQLGGYSLAGSLTSLDNSGQPLEADMSISLLPGETRQGTFGTSIYPALLLESDLQGYVENPAWYFENEDFERLRALDYLLLTQGRSEEQPSELQSLMRSSYADFCLKKHI